MKLKTILVSIGLGAGLMYFYDPQHGERRRTMVRDRANKLVNDFDDSIDMAVRDARNRARGVLSEMTAKLSDEGAPDWILEERVRSNLGRMGANTRAVSVTANGGRVILSGPVLRDDVDAIETAARRTRGVHSVDNQLQVFDSPESIPSLQGESPSRQNMSDRKSVV